VTHSVNVSTGLITTGFPLALRGYDPVSYFTGGPVAGDAKHALVHKGATYYFANAENAAAFGADPARYLPSFGGFCAYGVSVGKKFDGDPTIYKIVEGRTHLNLNADIHQAFLADAPGAIAKAHAHWPTIVDKAAATLRRLGLCALGEAPALAPRAALKA